MVQFSGSTIVTRDGAVPVQFRVESGNATDDRSHQATWELLCQLTGRRDFLYVADCKLATAENMASLTAAGGAVFLGVGAMNTVVTTLAHGCFAGVLGYAVGIARFAPAARRGPVLLSGLFVAAILNGVFGLLESLVRVSGLTVQPWRGVAFAAVFAAAVFGVMLVLVRRHLDASTHVGHAGPAAGGAHV